MSRPESPLLRQDGKPGTPFPTDYTTRAYSHADELRETKTSPRPSSSSPSSNQVSPRLHHGLMRNDGRNPPGMIFGGESPHSIDLVLNKTRKRTRSSTSSLGTPSKDSNSQKSRRPTCARCKNHGLIIAVKSHKRYCEWRHCVCASCIITVNRQRAMAIQVKHRRDQVQDEARAAELNAMQSSTSTGPDSETARKHRRSSDSDDPDSYTPISVKLSPPTSPELSANRKFLLKDDHQGPRPPLTLNSDNENHDNPRQRSPSESSSRPSSRAARDREEIIKPFDMTTTSRNHVLAPLKHNTNGGSPYYKPHSGGRGILGPLGYHGGKVHGSSSSLVSPASIPSSPPNHMSLAAAAAAADAVGGLGALKMYPNFPFNGAESVIDGMKDSVKALIDIFRLPMETDFVIYRILKDYRGDFKLASARILEAQTEYRSWELFREAARAANPYYTYPYYYPLGASAATAEIYNAFAAASNRENPPV